MFWWVKYFFHSKNKICFRNIMYKFKYIYINMRWYRRVSTYRNYCKLLLFLSIFREEITLKKSPKILYRGLYFVIVRGSLLFFVQYQYHESNPWLKFYNIFFFSLLFVKKMNNLKKRIILKKSDPRIFFEIVNFTPKLNCYSTNLAENNVV